MLASFSVCSVLGASAHAAPAATMQAWPLNAAQRTGIPYALSTAGGATIEEVARLAPDVFWFQLYRLPANDHAVSRDLVKGHASGSVDG